VVSYFQRIINGVKGRAMTDEKAHADGKKKGNGRPISPHPLTVEGALVGDGMRNVSPILVPGLRVELTGTPTAVTLRSRTGKVVREDEDDDYVIVQLDTPALYRHANGEVEELPEIVVMTENLRILGL